MIFSVFIPSAMANEKIEAEYFWLGEGIEGYSEDSTPWVKQFEKDNANKIKINYHETWKNHTEAVLFYQLMTIYGIPKREQRVPCLIVNNHVFFEEKEIKDGLQNSLTSSSLSFPIDIGNIKQEVKEKEKINMLISTGLVISIVYVMFLCSSKRNISRRLH